MRYLLTGIALAFIMGCDKEDKGIDAELAKLPPITQTGAKTFGCLVNGKAVTPNSNCTNCPPPLSADFDFSNNGGFGIVCTYNSSKNNIIIGLDSIFSYKMFQINDSINKNVRVSLYNTDIGVNCERVGYIGALSNFTSITGKVTLSRVDVPNGIFSGTFNFTIKTKNCGNYEVTNGRFDYKF